jgi:hypothetical protein
MHLTFSTVVVRSFGGPLDTNENYQEQSPYFTA